VVSDPKATLPSFQQDLDGLAARAVNALYGRWGHFWEGDSYHATQLDTPEEILDRCAYTLANPVAAGLVRRARQWPGLWSAPEQAGETVTFERPSHFFRKEGGLPEKESLKLAVPRGFASAEAFRERLAAALAAREEKAAGERLGFLGVARVLRQRAHDRPKGTEKRREQAPRFAARSLERVKELTARLRAFLGAYWEALAAWKEGRRKVVFPAGTYRMRVEHRVTCAGAG
jgi:hypothetical protein